MRCILVDVSKKTAELLFSNNKLLQRPRAPHPELRIGVSVASRQVFPAEVVQVVEKPHDPARYGGPTCRSRVLTK